MARSPEAMHKCPLLKRDIFWGDCYEVQEIRNDELEPSFFRTNSMQMKQIKFAKFASGTLPTNRQA